MNVSDTASTSKLYAQVEKNECDDMYDIDLKLEITIEANVDGCSTNTVTCTCRRVCR